jgi:hypothetical protein
MVTIEITVPDATYAEYRRAARVQRRPMADLFQDALETYRQKRLGPRRDLTSWSPVSVGRVLRPLGPDDDLLTEAAGRSGP